MNSSFKKNLVIAYLLSLALLIISAVASYISIKSLINSTDSVNHTNIVINQLEHTISLLKDAETGQRGFLLGNDEKYLEPYENAKKELPN